VAEDGVFTVHGITASESASGDVINGLDSRTIYDIRIRTYTPAHAEDNPDDTGDDQINALWSDYRPVISAMTLGAETGTPMGEPTDDETDTPPMSLGMTQQ